MRRQHTLRLPDGRTLAFARYGAPDGLPVVTLHGTPGSHLKFSIADEAAARLGLTLISVDRWGYGGSDRPHRPSLAAYAADMRALADHLQADRIGLVGISGGGPFAAAAAAGLGARVAALALIAPVGPIAGSRGAPLRLFHRLCFQLLPRVPGAVRLVFGAFRMALTTSPGGALRIAAARASAADRRLACSAAAQESLAHSFRVGLAGGLDGPVIDMTVFSRRWDFELADVVAPARVWLGDKDNNIPRMVARRLAGALPHGELVELAGHGHFWITQHYGEVLDWLRWTMTGAQAAAQLRRA